MQGCFSIIINKSKSIYLTKHFSFFCVSGLDEGDLSETECSSATGTNSGHGSWFRSELARLRFDLQGSIHRYIAL